MALHENDAFYFFMINQVKFLYFIPEYDIFRLKNNNTGICRNVSQEWIEPIPSHTQKAFLSDT